jgi:hypothetical protein
MTSEVASPSPFPRAPAIPARARRSQARAPAGGDGCELHYT